MKIDIGESLKYHRENKNLSLLQLEKATGISNQNLGRWEKNQISPNIIYCIRLAEYYGISLDELIGRNFPQAKITYYKSPIINNNINIK